MLASGATYIYSSYGYHCELSRQLEGSTHDRHSFQVRRAVVENDLTSSASLIMYKAPSSALAGVSVPVVTVGGAVGQLYCSVQDEWLYPGLLYNYLTAVTNIVTF